jgi:hypothetical protein
LSDRPSHIEVRKQVGHCDDGRLQERLRGMSWWLTRQSAGPLLKGPSTLRTG